MLEGATILLPLPPEFEDSRFRYTQVERTGDLAIFTQTHKTSGHQRYEVVLIRIQKEHTWPNGNITPEKEAYPGSTSWGRLGRPATPWMKRRLWLRRGASSAPRGSWHPRPRRTWRRSQRRQTRRTPDALSHDPSPWSWRGHRVHAWVLAPRVPLRCVVCHIPDTLASIKLCDAPRAPGQPCDTPVCVEHAAHVEPDTDYCPRHAALARKTPSP